MTERLPFQRSRRNRWGQTSYYCVACVCRVQARALINYGMLMSREECCCLLSSCGKGGASTRGVFCDIYCRRRWTHGWGISKKYIYSGSQRLTVKPRPGRHCKHLGWCKRCTVPGQTWVSVYRLRILCGSKWFIVIAFYRRLLLGARLCANQPFPTANDIDYRIRLTLGGSKHNWEVNM